MDDDKAKKEPDNADDSEENGEVASTKASSDKKAVKKPSSKKEEPVLDEDEDEDEEDDEDEDEEDDEDDEDDEDEDEDEEEEPKPKKKVSAPKKKSAPVVKLPSQLPLPPRNTEILTGLGTAIAGYLAFWYGWSVYNLSIEKHHVNFFSHSAWAFLISFFMIILAAFYFVRLERRELTEPKQDPNADPKKGHPYRERREDEKSVEPRKLDRLGVMLAALVCGPFYVIYWWKAYDIWKSMYAADRPVMWVIYVAMFAFMSLGLAHGLRPPTDEDETQKRMPGRRVLLLVMTPFSLVYGMIYLASLYPPWPS